MLSLYLFIEWFYDPAFRSWWQLNGCVGVPLYKIYRRNTQWKSVISDEERRAKAEAEEALKRADSTDDLIREICGSKNNRNSRFRSSSSSNNKNDENNNDSTGDRPEISDSERSTPEHLKGYKGSLEEDEDNATAAAKKKSRLRTFSETLKMLDDDILQELSVK